MHFTCDAGFRGRRFKMMDDVHINIHAQTVRLPICAIGVGEISDESVIGSK
jgi:hypothetical protein